MLEKEYEKVIGSQFPDRIDNSYKLVLEEKAMKESLNVAEVTSKPMASSIACHLLGSFKFSDRLPK